MYQLISVTNQNNESAKTTSKGKSSTKETVDRDNLFSRIEESRMALEDELGMDLFIKVYRHVQVTVFFLNRITSHQRTSRTLTIYLSKFRNNGNLYYFT